LIDVVILSVGVILLVDVIVSVYAILSAIYCGSLDTEMTSCKHLDENLRQNTKLLMSRYTMVFHILFLKCLIAFIRIICVAVALLFV